MNTPTVHRYIAIHEKIGDALTDKITLTKVDFEAIRHIFGYDISHQMFECYPLKDRVLGEVAALLQPRLNTGDYDYFLETESL
jgi:hypothetical protein